jgi:hypothetical protein
VACVLVRLYDRPSWCAENGARQLHVHRDV